MKIYVLLDNQDYYGPHFDNVFVSRELLENYISNSYDSKWRYEILEYDVNKWGDVIPCGNY